MGEDIILNRFGIAPLQTNDDLVGYDRLPDLVSSVSNELAYSAGGSFLITGYRGVGKTSFVNKVLYEVQNCQACNNKEVIVIRLNLARGYSTDKLLRRMIRELYYCLDKQNIFDHLNNTLQGKLNIAFLRTSRQVKTALSEGLKQVITKSRGKGRAVEFSPTIGVESVTKSIASLSGKYSKSSYEENSESKETATERGIELEFLEYDDEIAESDLCELIDAVTSTNLFYRKVDHKELPWRKPEFFWKILPAEISVLGRKISISRKQKQQWEEYTHGIKIIFVLDEIDKISVEQAEEIFRSLKNLFLKGNVTFISIGGKEFYYHWLRKRASEDDVFFSLFTRIVHIPLFDQGEFKKLTKTLIEPTSVPIPSDLMSHLLFRAKGTPREFLRELFHQIRWKNNHPVIDLDKVNQAATYLSCRLYPFIDSCYQELIDKKDIEIDQGILDHIRRCLHNWLDEMMYQVSFTKQSILKPDTNSVRPQNEILFPPLTYETLDNLFSSLLRSGIIEKTTQLPGSSDPETYQFTAMIRSKLQVVESTVSDNQRSEQERKDRNIRVISTEVNEKLLKRDFYSAKEILETAEAMDLDLTQRNLLLLRVNEGIDLERSLKVADVEYQNNNFLMALEIYRRIKSTEVDFPDLDRKIQLCLLKLALEESERSLIEGDYRKALNRLYEARGSTESSRDSEIIQLRQQAGEWVGKLENVLKLTEFVMTSTDIEAVKTIKAYKELLLLAPNSPRTRELEELVITLEMSTDQLKMAEDLLSSGNLEKSEQILRRLRNQSNKEIRFRADQLYEQVKFLKSSIEKIRRSIEVNDIEVAENILGKLEDNNPEFLNSEEVLVLRDKILAGRKAKNIVLSIENTIEKHVNFKPDNAAFDLTEGWEALEELERVVGKEGKEYKSSHRKIQQLTLDRAQNVANELVQINRDPATMLISDASMMITKVARILDPLLKLDPENVEANMILDTLKKKLNLM